MSFQNVSPYIRIAMDSIIQSPWMLKERMLWDYELLYLMEGRADITIEDKTYEGRPGDLFLFKPGKRHSIQIIGDNPIRQPHVHFDLFEQADSGDVKVSFKMLQDMDETERSWFRKDELSGALVDLPTYIRLREPSRVEQQLFGIISEFEAKLPLYEWRLKGSLLELITYIVREHAWNGRLYENSLHQELLLDIERYIAAHVHRELKLDELSERFHISKYYLIHLFNKVFDVSPIQYHQRIRLERAKNMIRHTLMPLQEIADQLGFSGIHAFSRAFKKKVGVSPAGFRKEFRDEHRSESVRSFI
ncbi:AraC family transcriptional regulator [Paenibacillus sp. Root444D2]|uniref:AraC family transcriptional regulator n=1 Tax=Paenibacillus sp. Root444D2 TaxID=1736538 RepID=UPI000710519B|nr:AraC family transcriptional regulator [Paenibacillus sp. Root444D2]KQX45224.1 hypothetical protein ASD40_20015 [Paenibacillus sp. Root444D2]